MKKIFYCSAAVILALSALSCNRQVEVETPQPAVGSLTFRAVLEQPVTKADLSNYAVVWQAGDQIAVYNGSEWVTSDPLEASAIQNNGRYAEFSVSIAEAAGYWAVYPASAAPDAAISGDDIPVVLPAVQVIASGNSVAKDAIVQVCKTADKDNMVFKNVTSLVEFKAPEAVDGYVSFEAFGSDEAALPIAGTATVNADTPVAVSGDAGKVTVKGSFAAGENYFAVIYPQSAVSKFRFAFSKEDSSNGTLKAFRTGSAGTLEFPLNGGNKFSDLGTLNWLGPLSSKADLDKWAKYADYYLEGETVKLGADIDYEGGTWKPVNGNATRGLFSGIFDGQGFSIYNIIINTASGQNCGFFSNLSSATQQLRAKNLKLGYDPATNKADGTSKIEGTNADNTKLGALAGLINNAIIVGIDNYINVSATQDAAMQMAGLIGRCENTCHLSNCNNYATIDGKTANNSSVYIGGLFGTITGDNSVVQNCSNYGTVQRSLGTSKGNTFLAGIVGRVGLDTDDVVISGCINNGTIKTTVNTKNKQLYIGGITSMDNTIETGTFSLIITDCLNKGLIECTSLSNSTTGMGVGGIIGYAKNGSKISGCINTGTINKPKNHNGQTSRFGGIVGWSNNTKNIILNCTNGSPSDNSVGTITSLVQTTTTDATLEYYGGIVGDLADGTVRSCKNYGSLITASTTADISENAGGIIGAFSGGAVENCENYGSVSVAAAAERCAAGGLIGVNLVESASSTGEGCKIGAEVQCGYADNAGAVTGLFSNTATSVIGSSASPVKISALTSVNGTVATSGNYQTMMAGSAAGITASGVVSTNGLNTIWATFE